MRQSLSLRNASAFVTAGCLVVGGMLFRIGYTPVWLMLIGLGAAVFWVVDYVRAQRHRSEYAEFAALHGWNYSPGSFDYNSRFVSAPFGVGIKRHQSDVLRGTLNGVECATFTHRYELEKSGGDSTDYVFQVTLVELPVTLPRLELIPESIAQRLAKSVGAMDIDFESHAFNRMWRVRAADRKYAHDVLDPRMLERLTQSDVEGVMIRIEGGAVMTWSAGRAGVDGLAARLGVLTAIARRIPDHVIREYTERGLASHHGKYAPDGDRHRPLVGPDWAVTPGALTSGRYTGIDYDIDGPSGTSASPR